MTIIVNGLDKKRLIQITMHNEILLSFIKKNNIWLQIQNHKRVSYRKKHTSQIFFSKLSLFPSVLVIKIIHYHTFPPNFKLIQRQLK